MSHLHDIDHPKVDTFWALTPLTPCAPNLWSLVSPFHPGGSPALSLVDLPNRGSSNRFIHPICQDAVEIVQLELLKRNKYKKSMNKASSGPWKLLDIFGVVMLFLDKWWGKREMPSWVLSWSNPLRREKVGADCRIKARPFRTCWRALANESMHAAWYLFEYIYIYIYTHT